MKEHYSCVIIDDEPAAHLVLKNYIQKESRFKLSAQFYNIPEAKQFLKNNLVDLLFLDIHMPEISGLEFLKMEEKAPKTILTTAYSQYALESYNYGVVDYLLKPISYARFQKSIGRIIDLDDPKDANSSRMITIKVDGIDIQLLTTDIDYIQSFGNYVKIFAYSRYYLVPTTTQEILSHLSSKLFLRIHKSYIINLDKITKVTGKDVIINGNIIPVGITFKRELLFNLSKKK